MSVFILTITSSPKQLSFYGHDVLLGIEVTSPPTQFFFMLVTWSPAQFSKHGEISRNFFFRKLTNQNTVSAVSRYIFGSKMIVFEKCQLKNFWTSSSYSTRQKRFVCFPHWQKRCRLLFLNLFGRLYCPK